jgi:catechol 2,3-dioxygenase-like lactoylglutathione lyase family enzyme
MASSQVSHGKAAMTLKVQALDHLVVQVSDLEVSASWYERVLGMAREEVRPAPGKPPRTKKDWFTADHEAAGSEGLCFLTDATPDEVVQHLRAEHVAIVTGPAPRQGALGTLISVYCRDPDSALFEIASYAER